MAPASAQPYIGSKIRLVSNAEIRYEGILTALDTQESTISLQSVRCFGNEGRKEPHIPPTNEVYDFIVFRGTDIKDLTVIDGSNNAQSMRSADPAIADMGKGYPKGKGKEGKGAGGHGKGEARAGDRKGGPGKGDGGSSGKGKDRGDAKGDAKGAKGGKQSQKGSETSKGAGKSGGANSGSGGGKADDQAKGVAKGEARGGKRGGKGEGKANGDAADGDAPSSTPSKRGRNRGKGAGTTPKASEEDGGGPEKAGKNGSDSAPEASKNGKADHDGEVAGDGDKEAQPKSGGRHRRRGGYGRDKQTAQT